MNRRLLRRAALLAALAAVAATAAPASAKIVHLPNGRAIAIALRPMIARARAATGTQVTSGQLVYHGGSVLHSSRTVAIYWQPAGQSFSSPSFTSLVDRYFSDVAHDSGSYGNAYSVVGQYGDGTGSASYAVTDAGSYVDTNAYPTAGACTAASACVTDAQIQAEISSLITAGHVPAATGSTIYFVFLPQNVVTCGDSSNDSCSNELLGGFCGYHDMASDHGGHPYAVILDDALDCSVGPPQQPSPNDASADAAISTVSHEHIEAITDPNPASGHEAWYDSSGAEIGDKCAYDFGAALGGTGSTAYNESINSSSYELQREWSNDGSSCLQYYPPLAQSFSASPNPIPHGQSVGFSAASTANPDASYSWSFGDGAGAGGPSVSHSYVTPGSYTAKLTVTGDGGRKSVSSTTVTVTDQPPLARFSLSAAGAATGQALAFDAIGSSDPDGTVTGYAWDFGDGSGGAGAAATHAYAHAGSYAVTLTVTDNSGSRTSVSHTISISDRPPSASLAVSAATMRHPTAFAAAASDPDGGIVSYAWSFGDGSTASGPNPTHAYAEGGSYPVSLVVTDDSGSQATVIQTVSVGFVAPHGALAVRRQRLRSVIAHGFKASYSADEPGSGALTLFVSARAARRLHIHVPRRARRIAIARLGFSAPGPGTRTLTLRAGVLRRLGGVALVVQISFTNQVGQTGTSSSSVVLR